MQFKPIRIIYTPYRTKKDCPIQPIYSSNVQLEERSGNTLIVKGVDVLDGTPRLDIKPYIPKFDIIESASNRNMKGR